MPKKRQQFTDELTRGLEALTVNGPLWVVALSLILSSCGGGGNGSGSSSQLLNDSTGSNDEFFIPVTIAENETSVAGFIDWESVVAVGTQEISAVIPEDTALLLSVGSANSSEPVSIISFAEFGAAALVNNMLGYTPNLNYFGNDRIRILRDSIEYDLIVSVTPVNDAPVIVGDIDRVAEQGVRYVSQLEVRNIDQDVLRFSATNLPTWLQLDVGTGLLSGTPEQDDVGIHEGIRLIVRDAGGLEDVLANLTLEVLDVNDAPTLNISQFPDRLDARESIAVNVFPDDIDGDSVSLVIEPNDFVTSSVNGGTVNLTVDDVIEVTKINLVLNATDQLGNQSREVVPLSLFPLTESGTGRTLRGRQSGAGIHLVVLGDGYRVDQLELFRTDVEALIQTMQDDPAVELHLSAWNIHMIETPSIDAGIDDDVAIDIRDTVFDSGYFCLSVPRLICGDNGAMFDVALDEYPNLDELVLLVNDPRFGGSGGSVAVASSIAPEIALHELGHSLANLADEYVDNSIPALNISEFREGEIANISTHQDPALVPWSVWIDVNNTIPTEIGEEGVGIFQGGFYQADSFFRPTFNSRMRTFDRPFGPVNGETWALSVYRETNAVASFSPRTDNLAFTSGEPVRFKVEPIFGPEIQRIVWTLDGEPLTTALNERELNLQFNSGEHVLTVEVSDITGAIRKPGPHAAQFSWQWDITVQ